MTLMVVALIRMAITLLGAGGAVVRERIITNQKRQKPGYTYISLRDVACIQRMPQCTT